MRTLTPLPIDQELRAWYGRDQGDLPETYLVIDVETSGLDPKQDVITQIAARFVRDGEVVNTVERTLDWSRDSRMDVGRLLSRMAYVRQQMTQDIYGDQTGVQFDFDLARLKSGDPPNDVLTWIRDKLFASSRDYLVVGHNLAFDESLLRATLSRFLYWDNFEIPSHRYFDTCGFVRAAMSRPQVLPTQGELAKAYWTRAVRSKRELDQIENCKLAHCVSHFELTDINVDRMHTHAEEDVIAAQQLYEICRQSVGKSPRRQGTFLC